MKLPKSIVETLINNHEQIDRLINKLKECKKDIKFNLDNQTLGNIPEQMYIEYILKKSKLISKSFEAFNNYAYIEDKYPHNKEVTPEREYFRDIAYSIFHRHLDKKCSLIDLDFIEFRNKDGKHIPVLLYDIKVGNSSLKSCIEDKYYKYRAKKYYYVSQKLCIPYWVVCTDNEMKRFDIGIIDNVNSKVVWHKHNNSPFSTYEYMDLIESL